jgi:hypothetical protein
MSGPQISAIDQSVIQALLSELEVCEKEAARREFLRSPINRLRAFSMGIRIPKILTTRSIEAIKKDLACQPLVRVAAQQLKPGDEVDASGCQRIFMPLAFDNGPRDRFFRYNYIDLDVGTVLAEDLSELKRQINIWQVSLGGVQFAPWPAMATQLTSTESQHLDRFTDEYVGTSSTSIGTVISQALAAALRPYVLATALAPDEHPQAAAYIAVDLPRPLHVVSGHLTAADRAAFNTKAAGPIYARRVHFHQFLPPTWTASHICPREFALDFPTLSIEFVELL